MITPAEQSKLERLYEKYGIVSEGDAKPSVGAGLIKREHDDLRKGGQQQVRGC